ncbi:MAG TPA: sugar ABC transporter substrate-binding protein [Candidatus Agrococcus pullicola]|uniref:Sugar ABC transporter substrate-binding protein n=1 Tax=Candidatus Agrococcus pullicola TaxID=2838429 RepID=A0A9D1YYD4_9MICO|nr:sugar ABC transporter substrate-binding protein [Candidatus Agrococcus pullicola]
MRNRTRGAAVLASIVALSAATACSGSGGDGGDTGAGGEGSGADDVDLRMTIWSANPDHVAIFEELGAEFAESSPSVSGVSVESFNLAELNTLMTTQIQAGDAPDVSWLPVESSLEYVRAGALVDLSETLEATEGFDLPDFIPSLMERWTDGDAIYGVPFSTGPLVMYFNKDLYAEAGVKNPEELIAEGNWTWEAFQEASKEVSDALGNRGYVLNDFDFQNWTRLLPFMNAYGASPWNDDASTCTMNSPEMVEAMTVFHDMTFADGSMPVPGQQVDFWGGQVAATSAFLGGSASLQDADFEWGLVPTPAGPAGAVVATGQASIVALAAGNNTSEAAEFVAFLGSKDPMAEYSGFFPPIRESLLTPETLSESSPVLTPELVQPVIDGVKENGQVFPVAENDAAVADALNSALDEFLYQPDADVADAMDSVCAAIDPLLQ